MSAGTPELLFADHLVVLRGGGDLATGVAFRLVRAGFPVIVLELALPLTVRRTVALSTAVTEGRIRVEDLEARVVDSVDAAVQLAATGVVPVLVDAGLPSTGASVVVDARMTKHANDTTIVDAPLVVGLGPGLTAGVDCHAVIETMRGHRLGRVIWEGDAAPNTGIPGSIGGRAGDRVLRAPTAGTVEWDVAIAEVVRADREIGRVDGRVITAPLDGVVRGLITPGAYVEAGTKVGDIDPRGDPAACFEISDKSVAIGGGVVEAVLTWLNRAAG
jgi:xanthine dehydrogenase accessory factor